MKVHPDSARANPDVSHRRTDSGQRGKVAFGGSLLLAAVIVIPIAIAALIRLALES